MNPKDNDLEPEPEPTAEERAEAADLARALESGAPGATTTPDDALAAAALLRHARCAQDPDAAARTDARIAAAAARVLPAVDKRRPRRRWVLPALLIPASAAALLVVTFTLTMRPRTVAVSASVSAAIPAPPVALLEAQAQAAHAGADLSALDRQMRDYRQAYYAAVGGGVAEEP